jgi:hypothetical protein
MVGKCEQQRSLIIGSPSGYRVALIDIPRLFFRAESTQGLCDIHSEKSSTKEDGGE